MKHLNFVNVINPSSVAVTSPAGGFEEIGFQEGLRFVDEASGESQTVLCSNDRLAFGFLSACHVRNVRVGKAADCNLRVAAHDDNPFSRFTCPSLTTVAHDYDSVAGKAIELLLELIGSGGKFNERIEHHFPAKLVLRSSA